MRGRTGRRVASVAALGALAVATAGCGSDSGGSQASPATPTTNQAPANGLPAFDAEQRMPPNDVGSLRRLYDPVLEPMGLRLTRGALIDTSNDQYTPSNDGTHLALYVEPTGPYTDEQYIDGFWSVTALITPDVFARWPGIETYDICQEPLPADDDREEPFPVTQINITRAAAATIDWANGDLVDLLFVARTDPDTQIVVNRDIRKNPAYEAADTAARQRAGLDLDTIPPTTPN
jgi:hypothetical protein